MFSVVGQELHRPGLTVTGGGRSAIANMDPDNVTVWVTAPHCANEGTAMVEVCTDYGCDSEANGFHYNDG